MSALSNTYFTSTLCVKKGNSSTERAYLNYFIVLGDVYFKL